MSNRVFTSFFGVILIIFGVLLTLDRLDVIDFEFWDFIGDMWPLILIGAGLWLIYDQTKKGKNREWKDSITCCKSSKAFGDMAIKPAEIDQSGGDYSMGFGDLKIDFTDTKFQLGENKIDISLGCGDVFIMLPKDSSCKIHGSCGIGDLTLLGNKESGFGISRVHKDDDYDSRNTKLNIRAKCGLGDVKVIRN
jgi:lia operon protein LiaF